MTTAPTVSASPAGGSYPVAQQVALAADEFGADIYYTLDGSDPISGDELSPSDVALHGPITISSETTTLKFVAFDPSNNHSSVVTEQYTITNDPVAATDRDHGGIGRSRNRHVELGAFRSRDAPMQSIVDYQVKVFTSIDASTPVTTDQTGGPDTSITIDGLTGDTPYWFTVSAKSDVQLGVGSAFGGVWPADPARCGRCQCRRRPVRRGARHRSDVVGCRFVVGAGYDVQVDPARHGRLHADGDARTGSTRWP